MSSPKFSLVILCYRSEESIIGFVEKVHKLLGWLHDLDYELVLVGNYWPGAKDKTPEVVKDLATKLPRTRAITLEKKGAMGWDLKTGIAAAQGEFIGYIDGDGQFPIDTILPPLYNSFMNDYDLAKTYRVVRGDGLYRLCISTIFNNLFSILFGTRYRDVNSKPKIIRGSILKNMNLQSDDWFIDAEIMIKAHQMKLKVIELPIHFVENENRASFIKFSALWEFIKNLYRFRF
ncbi:MAG: glycosyltransferase family 2 protein [Bdellovibrionota bacterium]